MTAAAPHLKTSRQIVEAARLKAAALLPTETHQSYPIPQVPLRGEQPVSFLYCPSRLEAGSGLFLLVPDHRADMNGATGDLLKLRPVTPTELGVHDEQGKILGRFGLPEGMTSEQYLAEQGRLYDAYDALLPVWASGLKLEEASDQPRAVAHEFRRLFARVSEPPLAPYYRAVGRDFFGWIDRAARVG